MKSSNYTSINLKFSALFLIALGLPFWGIAQEKLALENAVAIALKNNYDIQLAENLEQEADNNQSILNSGFLPSATASGNANYSNTNTNFTTQQGVENDIKGAEIQRLGASVGINYILFNGGARKYQFERLKQQYNLASTQKQQQIENTLIDVYTQFFVIAKTQEQQNVLEQAFQISKARLERVKSQKEFGQNTGLDVLNAQVDANADSINLINIRVELANAKRNLNFLLGRDIGTQFEVENKVVLDSSLELGKLKQAMEANNVQLKQLQINRQMANYSLQVSRAGWLPSISASASYGTDYSDNGRVGFFQNQQSTGLNAGLNLSWNLFDGGSTKTRVRNAELALESQELNEEKLKLQLDNQIEVFWAEYTRQKALIVNEKSNETVSRQNFLKSKERFHLGQISSLDFRQAQLNLIRTELNVLNAKYNAKLSELQLKQFAGMLVQ